MTRVLLAGTRVMSDRILSETRPLEAALAERGVDVAVVPWDAPADWTGADVVAVRTTWDYTERVEEFLAWASGVAAGTRLLNALPVLAWNSHKGYLVELADAGVPVVPTTLVPRGTASPPLGSGRVVVKPAVSAGGRGTHLGDADELTEVAAALAAEGDVLVQPAVEGIGRDGEVSLVRIGDRWSHAVRKVPAAGGFLVHERFGGRLDEHVPTAREVAVAEQALAASPAADHGVYASRVDLVRIDGEPVVMELELIEPDLFLRRAPDAAHRVADALLAAAG